MVRVLGLCISHKCDLLTALKLHLGCLCHICLLPLCHECGLIKPLAVYCLSTAESEKWCEISHNLLYFILSSLLFHLKLVTCK